MAKENQSDSGGDDKVRKSKSKDGKKELVGRVRKVVKKSRRKLSEEKFEKELQRTISFLEEIREKLNHPEEGNSGKSGGKATAKPAGSRGRKPRGKRQAG